MSYETEILDLVFKSKGKAAPFITEKLSTIGSGDMATGIKQIAQYFGAIGYEEGFKKGVITSATVVATGLGAYTLYKWHIGKVEERAKKWQRFDEQCRALEKERWAEYEELKAKVEQTGAETEQPKEPETEEGKAES